LFTVPELKAQTTKLSDDDLRVLKGQAQQMIGFFEYQQNILGDPESTLHEKQVVINESYKKSFADSLVQIEDDLDPTRKFPIFKDVQDYLKDIDFFFKSAVFSYDIIEMKQGYNQNNELFFTVLTKRKISATDVKNNKIDNYQNRYFELNYDEANQILKIASIYTTSPEDKTNWKVWWANLPFVWKSFFTQKYNLGDSLSATDIQNLNKITSVDISGRSEINDLNPLADIRSISTLNLQKSGVTDLMPLRFLKNLSELDLSNTNVTTVDALKYSTFIKRLNLANTQVRDIAILENLQKLEYLNISNSKVTNLSVLVHLPNITTLVLNKLNCVDYSVIQDLAQLKEIYLDSSNFSSTAFLYNHPELEIVSMNYTPIVGFQYLTNVDKLKEMHFEHTAIASLDGLENLKSLKKIYCDYSKVTKTEALKLNSKRPDIVVVFESQELANWWNSLDVNWKNYFTRMYKLSANPSTEDLHQVIRQTKISIKNNKGITNLDALAIFTDTEELEIIGAKLSQIDGLKNLINLNKLTIQASELKDISALSSLQSLKYIDISGNPVSDISALQNCAALVELHAEQCKIKGLPTLDKLKNLRQVYVDGNTIEDAQVQAFYKAHPASLVVYKSPYLQAWWSDLPIMWKSYFVRQFTISTQATNEELHRLIRTEDVSIKDINIEDLSPLKEFLILKSLVLSDLSLETLVSLSQFRDLENLSIIRLGISDISPIYQLKNLKNLSINETGVSKLDFSQLTSLEKLDISQNKIKHLGGIKVLTNLKELNISNTRIFNTMPIEKMTALTNLTAYNISAPYFLINRLKKKKPNLKIIWY
jgi:Leucine-rich repeat (LRR) protein